jgi:hypothetical protein
MASVLDLLPSDAAKPGILGRVIRIRRVGVKNAARAILVEEIGILGGLRVVRVLRLLLGVEVVEIAKELVEAMHGGQKFVAIAEVILAELAGGIAERFKQISKCRVLF